MIAALYMALRAAPSGMRLHDFAAELTIVSERSAAMAKCNWREWAMFTQSARNAAAAAAIGGISTSIEITPMQQTSADEPPAAHGIRVATTRDGSPLVELLDERGAVIAVAEFEQGKFAEFISECCDLLELAAKGGLASLPCKGQA